MTMPEGNFLASSRVNRTARNLSGLKLWITLGGRQEHADTPHPLACCAHHRAAEQRGCS